MNRATARHSDHPIEVQPLGGATDGRQLWFKPANDQGWLEISFQNEKEQAVHLAIKMTHSWDYGIYRVRLDGKEVGQFDLYSAAIAHSEHKLGMHNLTVGEHTLRFECVGKAEKSTGYLLGFDALNARIPVYSRAPGVDLRTLQEGGVKN